MQNTDHAPVTGSRGRGLVRDGGGVVVAPAVAVVAVTRLLDGGDEVLLDPDSLVTSITRPLSVILEVSILLLMPNVLDVLPGYCVSKLRGS